MPEKKIAAQPSLFDEAASDAKTAPGKEKNAKAASQEAPAKAKAAPAGPSAQSATLSLWAAIAAGVGNEPALVLAEALRAGDRLDFSEPVGHSRLPLIEAWAQNSNSGSSGSRMTAQTAEKLAAWAEEDGLDVWGKAGAKPDNVYMDLPSGPMGLFRAILRPMDQGHVETASLRSSADLMQWAFERAPIAHLKNWRSRSRSANGEGLLAWLVQSQAGEAAIIALLDRGFSLKDAKNEQGWPLARRLHTLGLWERFLADGGDPRMPVASGNDNEKTVPLWQHLRDRSANAEGQPQIKAAVEQWAKENVQGELKDLELKQYWSKFENAHNTAGSHMKSRPDWPTLRDPKGRTAMMHVVLARVAEYKTFAEIKKAREGVLAKDNEGRTLWAYMMANGNPLGKEAVRWLMGAIPLETDAKGRGLIAQALSIHDNRQEHQVLNLTRALLAKHQDPKTWWGEGPAQQDEMAQLLTEKVWWGAAKDHAPSRFVQHAWTVTRAVPTEGLSPKLLGALALAQLLSPNEVSIGAYDYSERPDWMKASGKEWGLKLIEAGGVLPLMESMSPTLRERIELGRKSLLDEAVALSEANELRHTIASKDKEPAAAGQEAKTAPASRRL